MPEEHPIRRIKQSIAATVFAFVISTFAATPAAAGVCDVSAFACPTGGACVITGTWDIGADCTLDFGSVPIEVKGVLRAESRSGSFGIKAADVTLSAGKLTSVGDSDEPGGSISVVSTGAFTMRGSGPRIDTAGNGGGGSIAVTAETIDLRTGLITTEGGTGETCGDGGSIRLEALSGTLVSAITVRSSAPGGDCGGGQIVITAPAVQISGRVDAHGGAWTSSDTIVITATVSDIVASSAARIDASGMGQLEGFGADAGEIALRAPNGSILLGAAAVEATGKSPFGAGGALSLEAAGDIDVGSLVTLYGGSSGFGGELLMEAGGSVSIAGDVIMTGGSSGFGAGGAIEAYVGGSLLVSSTIDASGRQGGDVALASVGPTTVSGRIAARGSSGGPGGDMELWGCRVNVTGTLDVGASNGGVAGTIDLAAAPIFVGGGAHVLAVPCADTECISMTTRLGGAQIDSNATVFPLPIVFIVPEIESCE